MLEKLIEEVRQHSCLYDIKSPDFRRMYLRDRLWCHIGTKLNLDISICRTKWKSLRDRYRKELVKLDLPAGNEFSAKKPWKYMEQLSFLNSSNSSRSTVLNIALSYSIGDDKIIKQCFESAVKDNPDPLRLSPLTRPRRSTAESLLPKSTDAAILPRLSSVSSCCTVIQYSRKRSSRNNPGTAKKILQTNSSICLSDCSKSLHKMGSMEQFMLSIATDVEKFGWSARKTLKYKNKVSQLTREVEDYD